MLLQVSRTDANVLYELNPQDMEVIQQMNYSAVIPEVQVSIAASSDTCMLHIPLLVRHMRRVVCADHV